MKDNFIFYKSFYEAIKKINNKEVKADVFEAICELGLYDNDVELTSEVGQMIMTLITPVIKANTERYLNGKKGGAPKGNTNAKNTKQPVVELKNNHRLNLKTTDGYSKKQPNKEVEVEETSRRKKKEVYFQNQDLENIFREFLEVRKKLKAVNSDRAIKMLIKKLEKYDDETKLKMIEQSIVKSWKDVYELKQNIKPKWFDENLNNKGKVEYTDEEQRIWEEIK